jgi:hypothetical protein
MTTAPLSPSTKARRRVRTSTAHLAVAALCCAAASPAAARAARPAPSVVLAAAFSGGAPAPPQTSTPSGPSAAGSRFQTTDDTGASMDALDIIVNPVTPDLTYLGVYHTNLGNGRFALHLGASRDLTSWRRIGELDRTGGGMGTLRALPGGGFLLAYEAARPTGADGTVDSNVRLRYYRDPTALLHGAATEQRTLPARLSATNEGTPDLRTIVWRGTLASSRITLGFHYLDHSARRPVDREAHGTLDRGRWSSVADKRIDRALSRMGFAGNHGGRREFALPGDGRTWRIYEAQRRVHSTDSWRLLLYDVGADRWTPLQVRTPGGSASLANPTLSVLPSPTASGATALVVTMFVTGTAVPEGESGEAVSWLHV